MYVIPRYSPETGVAVSPDELLQDQHFAAAHTEVLGGVQVGSGQDARRSEVVIEPHEIPALRQVAEMTGHFAVADMLGSKQEAVKELNVPEDEIPSELLTVKDPIISQQLWQLGHVADGIEVTVETLPNGKVAALGADTKDSLDLDQSPAINPGEATIPLFTHQPQSVEVGTKEIPNLELPVLGTVHFSEPAPNPLSVTQEKVVDLHTRHTRALGRMAKRATFLLGTVVSRRAKQPVKM